MKKSAIAALRGISVSLLVGLFVKNAAGVITVSDRRVLARFTGLTESAGASAVLAQNQATIIWRSYMIPGLVSIDCPTHNAAALCAALNNSETVFYAEQVLGDTSPLAAKCPRQRGNASALPTLPLVSTDLFDIQWSLKYDGSPVADVIGSAGSDINAVPAWDITKGDPSIIVAVVDVAVDIDHPSLVPALWTNPLEVAGDGLDNDQNGMIDDVHGAMFSETANGDPRPNPDSTDFIWSHGTAAAGIIVGSHDAGLYGIAPQCKLMSVGLVQTLDDFPFYAEHSVKAFDYVLRMGARISSWSKASTALGTRAFQDMLKVAYLNHHVVVCAAGNSNCDDDLDNTQNQPASMSREFDAIIGVAATDINDCLAKWDPSDVVCQTTENSSNYGSETILISAPGWWIVSLQKTRPLGNSPYHWWNGTSFATPEVAGAVALLLSVHPEYTIEQVKAKLVATGRPVPQLAPVTISGKVLNVGALVGN